MHDGDIDYSKFTPSELNEALSGINRQLYPKSYAKLLAARELMWPTSQSVSPPVAPVEIEQIDNMEPMPRYDEHGRYISNISLR